MTPDQEEKIRAQVDQIQVEGDLRREVSMNIKRLQEIGSYRGMRLTVVAYLFVVNILRTMLVLVRVRL